MPSAKKRKAQGAGTSPALPPAQATTNGDVRPVTYPDLKMVEYSSTSPAGPLTSQDWRVMLGWETEKQYQARMVLADPKSKPEHHLFGEDYHCLDRAKQKVRCHRNANNRPFDSTWAEHLVQTLLRFQWAGPLTIPDETVNGETVRISRYGRVLSGQHEGTACILADEDLQAERRSNTYDPAHPKYPHWNGHEHVCLETIVIYGLSEDERVLRTIDYVKPRLVADMLYTMELFRDSGPAARRELTKLLSAAIDLLWVRTDTKGYRTHPEVVGFMERHRTLLQCVEHLFAENRDSGGPEGTRRISTAHLNPGHCAALCYLMGCAGPGTDGDDYRNISPPDEEGLDWSLWDRAREFWARLASDRGFIPVRSALGRLMDSKPTDPSNIGFGGNMKEKLAVLDKAWHVWMDHPAEAGSCFTLDDLKEDGALKLAYCTSDGRGGMLPPDKVKLLDQADFGGIDCPDRRTGPLAAQDGPPEPDPTPDEIWGTADAPGATDRLRQEAAERRAKGSK